MTTLVTLVLLFTAYVAADLLGQLVEQFSQDADRVTDHKKEIALRMGHIGFVLMFSRRFTIGHWVLVGDHEGIVTDITIMNTRLKSFDGESIIIPNDVVSNQPITNRTEQGCDRTKYTAYSI